MEWTEITVKVPTKDLEETEAIAQMVVPYGIYIEDYSNLEQEAMEAWDERKRKARVLGEAAATKLLIPMIMMLIVVMAIIMIPAFLSFYGQ